LIKIRHQSKHQRPSGSPREQIPLPNQKFSAKELYSCIGQLTRISVSAGFYFRIRRLSSHTPSNSRGVIQLKGNSTALRTR
jgi:hypothetical protein